MVKTQGLALDTKDTHFKNIIDLNMIEII